MTRRHGRLRPDVFQSHGGPGARLVPGPRSRQAAAPGGEIVDADFPSPLTDDARTADCPEEGDECSVAVECLHFAVGRPGSASAVFLGTARGDRTVTERRQGTRGGGRPLHDLPDVAMTGGLAREDDNPV